jgi:hypothetical protein
MQKPLVLLLYRISILISKVTHTGSIHNYTQLVLHIHYSPLGLNAICHAWSQAELNTPTRFEQELRPHAPKGARSQDRHLTLRFPSAATTRNRTEKEMDHKHTLLLFIASCRLDVKDVESAVVCHHQRLLTPPFPRVKSRHT